MDKGFLRDFRVRSRTGCKTRHAKIPVLRNCAGDLLSRCGRSLGSRWQALFSPKWVPPDGWSANGACGIARRRVLYAR